MKNKMKTKEREQGIRKMTYQNLHSVILLVKKARGRNTILFFPFLVSCRPSKKEKI
jgi:hypothetical protein